jgi:hypothetical protein
MYICAYVRNILQMPRPHMSMYIYIYVYLGFNLLLDVISTFQAPIVIGMHMLIRYLDSI